jgi:hypothetical protein
MRPGYGEAGKSGAKRHLPLIVRTLSHFLHFRAINNVF